MACPGHLRTNGRGADSRDRPGHDGETKAHIPSHRENALVLRVVDIAGFGLGQTSRPETRTRRSITAKSVTRGTSAILMKSGRECDFVKLVRLTLFAANWQIRWKPVRQPTPCPHVGGAGAAGGR